MLALLLALAAAAPPIAAPTSAPAAGSAKESHRATGTIRAFGPERRLVQIAHDDIPGFMKPMTMWFEPGAASLDPFAPGDRVRFAFVVEPNARHVILWIEKL